MNATPPNDTLEPADRFFDSLLEEVFQNAGPPDLTDRILAARQLSFDRPLVDIEVHASDANRLASRRQATHHSRRWRWPTTVAAVCIAAALIAVCTWNPGGVTSPPEESSIARPQRRDSDPGIAERSLPNAKVPTPPTTPHEHDVDLTPPWERRLGTAEAAPRRPATRPLATPLSDNEIAAAIEQYLQNRWQVAAAVPSPPAEDSIWCRRVYLKLLGRIPTLTELNEFLAAPAEHRRRELVDGLLQESDYRREFSEYWAAMWTNILIGRRGGTGASRASREGLLTYLREAFAENRPYNAVVEQLLAAEGTAEPGSPAYNGAVNFWMEHYSPDAARITDRAARIFWGEPLGCVRCHDQMDGPAKQSDFWSLNVVLRTAHLTPGHPSRLSAPQHRRWQAVYYERPDGTLALATPKLPDGQTVDPSLLENPQALRKLVAAQWARSPLVARALANRLWAHFFGYGFTRAVEDMAPPRECTHPELLTFLAQQIEAHGYDLRKAIRWIVLSDAFARSSRVTDENKDDLPERGAAPLFTRYYTKPLGPEAVYQSLALIAGPQGRVDPNDLIAARKQHAEQLARRMDNDEGGEQALFEQGVQKSWALMNNPLMQRATSAREQGFLHRVAESDLSPTQQIEHLFMASLARKPTQAELKMSLSLLNKRSSDRRGALEDIWWALLNSNEFLSDH